MYQSILQCFSRLPTRIYELATSVQCSHRGRLHKAFPAAEKTRTQTEVRGIRGKFEDDCTNQFYNAFHVCQPRFMSWLRVHGAEITCFVFRSSLDKMSAEGLPSSYNAKPAWLPRSHHALYFAHDVAKMICSHFCSQQSRFQGGRFVHRLNSQQRPVWLRQNSELVFKILAHPAKIQHE